MAINSFCSTFAFFDIPQEKLDRPAGVCLPEQVDELAILHWINENRALMQYNDPNQTILDILVPEEASISSRVEYLDFLPNDVVLTNNLFRIFCEYFGIPEATRIDLNRMVDAQSVLLFVHSTVDRFMAFPYFSNVNYHHYQIFPEISLRRLMQYQDQAMHLQVAKYPFIYETKGTPMEEEEEEKEDKEKTLSLKRKFEEIVMDDDGDDYSSDNMDMDMDMDMDTDAGVPSPDSREAIINIHKHLRDNDWQVPLTQSVFERIVTKIQ